MPIYEYQCPCGTQFERVLPVARYDEAQVCECGKVAQKVILHAPRGYVQADICYDSPIDGRPITPAPTLAESDRSEVTLVVEPADTPPGA